MANAQPAASKTRRSAFTRFLDGVEWLGNLLPHPVTLFAILAVGVVLLSGFFGWKTRARPERAASPRTA